MEATRTAKRVATKSAAKAIRTKRTVIRIITTMTTMQTVNLTRKKWANKPTWTACTTVSPRACSSTTRKRAPTCSTSWWRRRRKPACWAMWTCSASCSRRPRCWASKTRQRSYSARSYSPRRSSTRSPPIVCSCCAFAPRILELKNIYSVRTKRLLASCIVRLYFKMRPK